MLARIEQEKQEEERRLHEEAEEKRRQAEEAEREAEKRRVADVDDSKMVRKTKLIYECIVESSNLLMIIRQ